MTFSHFESAVHDEEMELERMLKSLPKELEEKMRDKTDALDLKEAVHVLQRFIADRNKAKDAIFTRVHTIESPEIQQEVLKVTRSIEQTLGQHDYYLGEGTVGQVYRAPYAPHVCIKYIVDPHMLERHGNTMRNEISYLEDLDNFSVEGIRVPRVYFDHVSDAVTCFGMETIEGQSLDQIIADPEGCSFIEKIRTQNVHDVLRKMKVFITTLHEDKKLVHRDLATRNIMIDKEGGWWVIDFGKAKRIEIGDDSTSMSEATDFPTAENSIRKLFAAIR